MHCSIPSHSHSLHCPSIASKSGAWGGFGDVCPAETRTGWPECQNGTVRRRRCGQACLGTLEPCSVYTSHPPSSHRPSFHRLLFHRLEVRSLGRCVECRHSHRALLLRNYLAWAEKLTCCRDAPAMSQNACLRCCLQIKRDPSARCPTLPAQVFIALPLCRISCTFSNVVSISVPLQRLLYRLPSPRTTCLSIDSFSYVYHSQRHFDTPEEARSPWRRSEALQLSCYTGKPPRISKHTRCLLRA